jgi:hypothetical protein
MNHLTAKRMNLEPIFPENTNLGQRIFYDSKAGRYYDSGTDLYMPINYDPKNDGRVNYTLNNTGF